MRLEQQSTSLHTQIYTHTLMQPRRDQIASLCGGLIADRRRGFCMLLCAERTLSLTNHSRRHPPDYFEICAITNNWFRACTLVQKICQLWPKTILLAASSLVWVNGSYIGRICNH